MWPQFYYDPTKSELTYLPLPGETAASIDAVVPQLVERFRPTTVLASTSGGDVRFGGALSRALQMQGSVASTGAQLPASSSWTDPTPGERLLLKN